MGYNLLEKISGSINEDWSSKEISDYVYVKLCDNFVFDERYAFSKDKSLVGDIFDKDIDIFNVDSKKIVCNSFSKMFCEILNTLLEGRDDFDIALTYGEIGHVFSNVSFSDYNCSYDAIFGVNDFLNVKKNLPIKGIEMGGIDSWDGEIIQANSFKKIKYDGSGLSKIKKIESEANRKSKNFDEFFDMIIRLSDFSDLGIIEVYKLLDLQVKDVFSKSLKQMGLELFPIENEEHKIKLIFNFDGVFKYIEEEKDGVVKIKKIG